MAEVGEPVHREVESALLAQLDDAALAAMQRAAPLRPARTVRAVEVDRRPRAVDGEQQPGFLETFAHCGDVVVQATLWHAELEAGRRIVQAGAASMCIAIRRIDDAARKHPRAAVVIATLGAARQQDFETCRAVAHDHQRRRRAWRALRR